MAVFKYKMQNILTVKEKLETRAKQDFAAAKKRLDEEQEKLAALEERKEGYIKEGQKLRLEKINVLKIRENKMAVLKMDESIVQQKININKAAQELEKARLQLTQVMQERKTHEKLKENAFIEFQKEEQAAESKEIDQLTTYTHGLKIRATQDREG